MTKATPDRPRRFRSRFFGLLDFFDQTEISYRFNRSRFVIVTFRQNLLDWRSKNAFDLNHAYYNTIRKCFECLVIHLFRCVNFVPTEQEPLFGSGWYYAVCYLDGIHACTTQRCRTLGEKSFKAKLLSRCYPFKAQFFNQKCSRFVLKPFFKSFMKIV